MLRLVTIIFIATLLGCGRGGVQKGPGLAGSDAEWFCEMAENGEEWSCVQDSELARVPRPSRLPQPKAPPAPAAPVPDELDPLAPAAMTTLATEAVEPSALLAETPPPPPLADTPTSEATSAATDAAADAAAEAAGPDSDAPIHVRLAYQPAEPTPILNMPADFYAVQLIAMSSREQLETFIDEYNLVGMSAARVERDGALYYVLLLGIYETRDLAEQASREIPPPLDGRDVWIRQLGTLQDAMVRGETLARSEAL